MAARFGDISAPLLMEAGSMRLLCLASALLPHLFAYAVAADPAKDPGGWGAVKFGMKPEEVLAALGPIGFVKEPTPEPRPFKLDETVDIPAAMDFAKETLRAAKDGDATHGSAVLEACKALLGENRRITWAFATQQFSGTIEYDPRSVRRLSANLEQITSWGGKGTSAYRRTLHLRGGPKVAQVPEVALDQKSKEKLTQIEDAIADISSALQREEDLRNIAAKREPQAVDPRSIKAQPVDVRGISLVPDFGFSGGVLDRITMSREYAGDGFLNFDAVGMQQTLSDALTDKYGRPDERNNTDLKTEIVWNFPTTVIRCVYGRWTAPNSAFTRKWVAIVYQAANNENENEKDHL